MGLSLIVQHVKMTCFQLLELKPLSPQINPTNSTRLLQCLIDVLNKEISPVLEC